MPLPLPWPFDREYMQLALVGGLVVGVTAPAHRHVPRAEAPVAARATGSAMWPSPAWPPGCSSAIWPIGPALVAAVAGRLLDRVAALERPGQRRPGAGRCSSTRASPAGWCSPAWPARSTPAPSPICSARSSPSSPSDALVIGLLGAGHRGGHGVTWRALFAIVLDEQSARVAACPSTGSTCCWPRWPR